MARTDGKGLAEELGRCWHLSFKQITDGPCNRLQEAGGMILLHRNGRVCMWRGTASSGSRRE